MTDWFEFTPVDERTTLIREPHVRGLLRANLWHLRGRDHDLLVDCGTGVAALVPLLVERFGRDRLHDVIGTYLRDPR